MQTTATRLAERSKGKKRKSDPPGDDSELSLVATDLGGGSGLIRGKHLTVKTQNIHSSSNTFRSSLAAPSAPQNNNNNNNKVMRGRVKYEGKIKLVSSVSLTGLTGSSIPPPLPH